MTAPSLKPLRLRLGTLLDVLVVSDPEHMKWLNAHAAVDRAIDPEASLLHRIVDGRLRGDLGFGGKLLPIFLARAHPGRAEQRTMLEDRLEGLRGAPGAEREEIAAYVAGDKHVDEIGVTVQQWCGRLFLPHYRASKESYDAAKLIAGWPTRPPWRAWRDRIAGRLDHAKNLVSWAADNDLHCVHGTTIGMENVAKSVRRMRRKALAGDKHALSPDDVVRQCLHAPPVVLRGCTAEVEAPFQKQPLTERTLIVLLVARGFRASGDLDDAFLADGWSRCPAHEVLPEMLRAVWHAVHAEEIEHKRILGKINGWGRLFARAVS